MLKMKWMFSVATRIVRHEREMSLCMRLGPWQSETWIFVKYRLCLILKSVWFATSLKIRHSLSLSLSLRRSFSLGCPCLGYACMLCTRKIIKLEKFLFQTENKPNNLHVENKFRHEYLSRSLASVHRREWIEAHLELFETNERKAVSSFNSNRSESLRVESQLQWAILLLVYGQRGCV